MINNSLTTQLTQTNHNGRFKLLLMIGSVIGFSLILIGGLFSVYQLTQTNQDIRPQASTPDGVATVDIAPTNVQLNPNGSQTFTISFNPKNIVISGFAIRLQFPFSGSQPLITASQLTSLIEQGNTNWLCPIKLIDSTSQTGLVVIDFACVYQPDTGFTSEVNIPIYTVSVTAGDTATTNPITLSFDPALTVIAQKSDGEDVAAIPQSTANITIIAAPTATPTMTVTGTPPAAPSATPSVTPTGTISVTPTMTVTGTPPAAPSATPSVTPALSSTPTPTRSVAASPTPTFRASATNTPIPVNAACNSYCATNRDCGNSLVCYNGQCRNERCPNDSSCSCQDYDPTSVTGSTQLPDSGSISQTVFNLLLGSSLIIGSGSMLLTHLRRKE